MYVRKTSIKEPVHTFHKRPIETALNHGLIYPIATSLNSWSFHIFLSYFLMKRFYFIDSACFPNTRHHIKMYSNAYEIMNTPPTMWKNEHHTPKHNQKVNINCCISKCHTMCAFNGTFDFPPFHYTDFVCCHHTRKLSNIYSMNLLLNCLHNAAVSILLPRMSASAIALSFSFHVKPSWAELRLLF